MNPAFSFVRQNICKIAICLSYFFISLEASSQNQDRFAYSKTEYSSYWVVTLFDNDKIDGQAGIITIIDKDYWPEIFEQAINRGISKLKRDSVSIGTGFTLCINQKGEISDIRFIINYKDTTLINESELFDLYHSFKSTKIDMSKIKIEPDYSSNWANADYARISGSLISQESRNRIKRNRSN